VLLTPEHDFRSGGFQVPAPKSTGLDSMPARCSSALAYAAARARRWLKRSILPPLTAACSRPV
jgi:hypothetical protein